MAKTLDEVIKYQLGEAVFLLCVRNTEIEKLKEENEQLKKVIEDGKHSS